MVKNILINLKAWGSAFSPRFKEFWFSDWWNPKKSFIYLPAFWFPFLIIIFFAFLSFLKVVVDEGLVLDITGNLNEWYRWFQVPIWILALLIPIIGLCNANHKSEQTKEVMSLTRSQNNFANYYKHVEEFAKHCSNIEAKHKDWGLTIHARYIHRKIFQKFSSTEFDMEYSHELPDQIGNLILSLGAYGYNLKLAFINGESITPENAKRREDAIDSCIDFLSGYLKVDLPHEIEGYLNIETKNVTPNLSAATSVKLNSIYAMAKIIAHIFSFAPSERGIEKGPENDARCMMTDYILSEYEIYDLQDRGVILESNTIVDER